MPYRTIIFANNEIYHALNRGVENKVIFKERRDYQRALNLIRFYQYSRPPLRFSHYNRLTKNEKEGFIKNLRQRPKIVEILAFCLMPNHFHFLIRQLQEKGIQTFMRNFQDSFARYFNTKYHRVGLLFQGMFRAVRIETDEQLIHVSRYIHLNPVSAYIIKIENLKNYHWSSFPAYLSKNPWEFVNPTLVLDLFKSKEAYKKFVFDQADYQRQLQKIKYLSFEER